MARFSITLGLFCRRSTQMWWIRLATLGLFTHVPLSPNSII